MKKFNYAEFSRHMRLKAAEYRMNVTDTAKELGVSKATISRINREIGMPDIETVIVCLDWLNEPLEKFRIR